MLPVNSGHVRFRMVKTDFLDFHSDIMPLIPFKTDTAYTKPEQAGIHNRVLIPFSFILVLALVIRVVAAIFSRGYAFHDDHFDVITIAQHWVEGIPDWLNEDMPPRHSMFYVGLHYVLFYSCDYLGFTSPDGKMVLVRLLHGIYSTLIVYFGYKITDLLAGKREARLVGLMLALMWFMPFMSVRNLVEMVCIPPYLAAFYLILKNQDRSRWQPYCWAGALFGLAFVFRYHSVLLAAGIGLVLLQQRQWRHLAGWLAGFVGVVTLIQGTIDYIFFDYPFASIVTYFLFNTQHALEYTTGPVHRYLLTLLGFLVPPVSVYLLFGYARTARLTPMLFWGGLLFFVAHSLFPNKQERFILPLLPLVILLGVIGWQQFVPASRFWQGRRKLLAYSWGFFWILNLAATLALCFTYTKKSRIAPLVYLGRQDQLKGILLEYGGHSPKLPPLFYLGRMAAQAEDFRDDHKNRWGAYKTGRPLPAGFVMVYNLHDEKPLDTLRAELIRPYLPDYVVVVGQDDLARRLQRLRGFYPNLQLHHTISPSLYDQVLHLLNPRVHKDEQVRIYRVRPEAASSTLKGIEVVEGEIPEKAQANG
jgi:hypothetical protein